MKLAPAALSWLEDVAAALARGPWRLDPPARLVGPDGVERVRLRRERADGGELLVRPPTGYQDRAKRETHVTFDALFPSYRDDVGHHDFRPYAQDTSGMLHIERTVRVGRPPTTVAKELERHVVAPWEPLYSDAWARMQAHRRQRRESEAFAARIGASGRDVYVGGLHLRVDDGCVWVHGGCITFEVAERLIAAAGDAERETRTCPSPTPPLATPP